MSAFLFSHPAYSAVLPQTVSKKAGSKKKRVTGFGRHPASVAKVCVLIWGMFHEFTYSMMIIIHDFCSGGTDSPSVVFLRRREGGLPGSVVVSPREVLHEESMPVASLSDSQVFQIRKSFRLAQFPTSWVTLAQFPTSWVTLAQFPTSWVTLAPAPP